MSRILARRCNNFRRALLQDASINWQSAIPKHLSTTSSSAEEDTQIISKSLARYRKAKDGASQKDSVGPQYSITIAKNRRLSGAASMTTPDEDIVAMLAKPTWSVQSLSPPETPQRTITQKQLHHLLRLSALPLPKDEAEEDKMLNSLHSQLHFVGDIQSVNTEGVEPLVRIAEETDAGIKENTIGLDDLRHVLDKEVVIGRNKKRRRVRPEGTQGEGEDWDVFKTANETVKVPGSGRYFVVRSGKGSEAPSDAITS